MADPNQTITVPESDLQGTVRTRFDSPEPTAAQLERREQSLAYLKSIAVPYLEHLPVVEDESTIEPRTAGDIAERSIAIAICAVKAEGNDYELGKALVERFNAGDYLSPNERRFIDDKTPSQQDLIDHAWSYEVLHVLLWALGYIEQINPPNEICDVPGEVAIISDQGGANQLAANARPRPLSELLDAADLYYHLHWSAIELRIHGNSSPALHEGIIRERHRALNWLIRWQKHQQWDEIETNT